MAKLRTAGGYKLIEAGASDRDMEASRDETRAHALARQQNLHEPELLGGSWDLVSMVINTLTGVISTYKHSYLNYNPSY